jgi:hypothetical protein
MRKIKLSMMVAVVIIASSVLVIAQQGQKKSSCSPHEKCDYSWMQTQDPGRGLGEQEDSDDGGCAFTYTVSDGARELIARYRFELIEKGKATRIRVPSRKVMVRLRGEKNSTLDNLNANAKVTADGDRIKMVFQECDGDTGVVFIGRDGLLTKQ